MIITESIAHKLAHEAATRNAQENGRVEWNNEDFSIAAVAIVELMRLGQPLPSTKRLDA